MIAHNSGFSRSVALLALVWLAFFLGCGEEGGPVEPASSLAWIKNPTVDASQRGQFSIAQGEVEGEPPPSKTYYIYTPKDTAYPQVENPLQADWIQAGWILVEDISAPVRVAEGEYILHGIAENILDVAQSPGIPVNVVKAIPPTTWKHPVTVNTEAQEGKVIINPGVADGDPAPSYVYYVAHQDSGAEAPPEGSNEEQDWYYARWRLIDTKDSLSVGMQAGSYSMYAVAVNAAETRLRSEIIEFQVTGFSPTWSQEPKFSINPYVFGRFVVENGVANGNPTPEVTYYFAPRGTSVPADDFATSWDAWERFFDFNVAGLNGIFDYDTGFYDFYAVARNAYDPPVRKGPYKVDLPYLGKDFRLIQEHIPNEWRDYVSNAGFFSDALALEDGTIILTGGDFENSYYSGDGGAHWSKHYSPSGLKGEFHGSLVELDNRILYLSGNGDSKVFKSVDGGMTFTDIGDAPWTPRRHPSALVFNGKIWVIGGALVTMTEPLINVPNAKAQGVPDIYYTEDYGDTWVQAVEEVPWLGLHEMWASHPYGVAAVFNDHLWFLADYLNGPGTGLWKSGDGITWNKANIAVKQFETRTTHALNNMFSYKNRMWMMEIGREDREGSRLQFTTIHEAGMEDIFPIPDLGEYLKRHSSFQGRRAKVLPWQDPENASNSGVRIIFFGNARLVVPSSQNMIMRVRGERVYGLDWYE